ncbi:MAG: hypothetical protein RRZ84_05920 [Romboutsia sp.]
MNSEYLAKFIDKNFEYYIGKFDKIQMTNSKRTWNWASFLFASYWALYRKMYSLGIIVLCTNFVISYIPVIGWLCNIAIWVAMGLYGNSIYLDHINKNIGLIESNNIESKDELIKRKGGVNPTIVCIVIIISIII